MQPPPVLEVQNLFKAYKRVQAVRGLSFRLEPGAILGFVGPNGAGKTTTLRAISGVIPPDSGSVHIAGHDLMVEDIAAKQVLAFVPDSGYMFDALTVSEHLQFFAKAYSMKEFEAEAEALLARFEIADKSEAFGHELSRGMKQRVLLCCALLHRPKLLLLDEPLTGLDPRAIRTLSEVLRERAEAGAAVVISSHILQWIEDLCTHLLLIEEGRERFFGSIDEAQARLGQQENALALEEIFFRITSPRAGGTAGIH